MNNNIYVLLAALFITQLGAQPISSIISQAMENNLELKTSKLAYEAAMQKGDQVNQLPDPTIGVGIPVMRPETRLGSQALMVSMVQMFPWFGSLQANKEVVLSMASVEQEKIILSALDLTYTIKEAYYNLFLLGEKQRLLQKNIRIFEVIEKLSLAKLKSGSAIASDKLSVQIKLEALHRQLGILENQKQRYYAQINTVLNQRSDIPVEMVENFKEPALIEFDIESFVQRIESLHPLLKQLDWQTEVSKNEHKRNKLAGKPIWGLGADYMLVAPRTDANPEDNGRDIFIPKFTFTIPIYRKKYAAKEKEEDLKQENYKLKKEQLTNQMIGFIYSYKAQYENAYVAYDLAKKQIALSEAAQNILMAEYSSKGTRFDELMKIQSNIIEYEQAMLEAAVQTHLMKVNVDKLLVVF